MLRVIVLCALGSFLCSCAAITNGKFVPVQIKSNPTGASIYRGEEFLGQTPDTVKLLNQKDQTLRFELAGYENQTVFLPSTLDAGYVVMDFLFTGGIVGLVIDGATGSWNTLDGIYYDEKDEYNTYKTLNVRLKKK